MGLGLSISKMITQQLGGEISVTSKPDVGSIFSFKIPINKFQAAPPADLLQNLI